VVASLAALGSVTVGLSCCLPLLPFLFDAGAAGTSAFVVRLVQLWLGHSDSRAPIRVGRRWPGLGEQRQGSEAGAA
jgi:hypothetical protein